MVLKRRVLDPHGYPKNTAGKNKRYRIRGKILSVVTVTTVPAPMKMQAKFKCKLRTEQITAWEKIVVVLRKLTRDLYINVIRPSDWFFLILDHPIF